MDEASSQPVNQRHHTKPASLASNSILLPPILSPFTTPVPPPYKPSLTSTNYAARVPSLPSHHSLDAKTIPNPIDLRGTAERISSQVGPIAPARVPRSLPDDGKEKIRKPQKVSKRSRKGCLTCRFRKRKCCETKPVCTECKRLGIKCSWITNGLENKNKSKKNPDFLRNDECYDDIFGVIKVVRGKIDYKIADGDFVEGNKPPDDELYNTEAETHET
ncbi:hypothetical protein KL918_000606 [Ogataea parapolymorpha]|uniref:Zn(2)-C6 fungal-type domain-containing protein n=1 Tax=Ogataea parapolymorpha (strain ATCC 26012 / BCRC 20466 / JCM 22074 / NRRL Y-7560 / DL-1) TaxID=871575 RepID=W1Q885_OGAPD|nr:hypothetical protein HPODL_01110 [Ogataea parapolymorpha DL-1]ESW96995.1 hypothetical protein HPODL_01110 [Ogataea parapolymorpha DL-1]KAG7869061.1 hypothetical protein KL918_000606 [Ogataea parapolymorpha]KAG7875889.1 hypothetical protein KL916_000560 [Ogataea parapolymorpha]KAG7877287.1 hypothetical protein KL938_004043 [Ogataea parapolymorpha]